MLTMLTGTAVHLTGMPEYLIYVTYKYSTPLWEQFYEKHSYRPYSSAMTNIVMHVSASKTVPNNPFEFAKVREQDLLVPFKLYCTAQLP